MNMIPLHNRQHHENIAWLSKPLLCIGGVKGNISVSDFTRHVKALVTRLPEGQHVINLCTNRYLFLLGLCASNLRAQTTLLPPNKNVAMQKSLAEKYEETYILHDDSTEVADLLNLNIAECNLLGMDESLEDNQHVEELGISPEHLSVISFTSGSTGDSKPNLKYWRTLVESSKINSQYMLPDATKEYCHLATVPAQHMWGFESSVLLTLFSKVCMVDAMPSFPYDIAEILQQLPTPKTLITTPLQLKTLVNSSVEIDQFQGVLCATAPLSKDLAKEVERKYSTTVREIYGCSEVGSMAVRQPVKNDLWEKFEALNFRQTEKSETEVSARHLLKKIILEDHIELHDAPFFKLKGRVTDQVKIAGKRGSLTEVNRVLQTCEGVSDGIVFFPKQSRQVPRLVALVVLEKGFETKSVRQHFQKHLDTAFVPRPILFVDALPREENGKVIKSELLAFYEHRLKNVGLVKN